MKTNKGIIEWINKYIGWACSDKVRFFCWGFLAGMFLVQITYMIYVFILVRTL